MFGDPLVPGRALFSGLFAQIIFCLTILLHILFAIGIYRLASRRETFQQQGCYCVAAWAWSLATLFGGVFVAATYWLIHDSAISRAPMVSDDEATSPHDLH